MSPGSSWTFSVSNTIFAARNVSGVASVSGSTSKVVSGYTKLTVSSSTDASITSGTSIYALELNGAGLFVRPSSGLPILLAGQEVVPTAINPNFTWVSVPTTGWDASANAAYGSMAVASAGSTWGLTLNGFLLDGTPVGSQNFSLTSGLHSFTSPTGEFMGANDLGVFALREGALQSGAFGFYTQSSSVGLANIAVKDFRAIGYLGGASVAFFLHPDGAGGFTGNFYNGGDSGIDTNWESTDPNTAISVSLLNEPTPGVVLAFIQTPSEFQTVAFTVGSFNGKMALVGATDQGKSLILVEP